ncbi:MAG: DUF1573 domain-containing protein [Spirochaetota bacterium]|nr:DUF1573 domain-containing protein [Spirochaetota bacterium]
MSKRFIIFSVYIIFSMLNLSCFGEPKIEFYETHHDFGEAGQNMTLKHTFFFKNAGGGTLLIKKIKAG